MRMQPPPPPPSNKRDRDPDEPSAKKIRMEGSEAHLIPEEVFMRTHPGPVTFTIQVPDMPDKNEWKLDGKPIKLTLPLTDQVNMLNMILKMLFILNKICISVLTLTDYENLQDVTIMLGSSSVVTVGNVISCIIEYVFDVVVLQVSVIKAKIHDVTGMPAGKQKLQLGVGDLLLVKLAIVIVIIAILIIIRVLDTVIRTIYDDIIIIIRNHHHHHWNHPSSSSPLACLQA